MTAPDTHRAIEAVFRIESARIIAALTRIVRDLSLGGACPGRPRRGAGAVPESGIPDNPGAWLMATAKHRAIDAFRRTKRLERKHHELGRELEADRQRAVQSLEAAIDDPVGDDLLRLMFTACHPVLSSEARVALTLRLLGGLTTEDLLARLGRSDEARMEFERAASLTGNARERTLLLERARECGAKRRPES